MNIAVSSVLIFIFLLPGIIVRRFYYTEEFSKQYFKQNFFELFLAAIIPSIFLHVFMSCIILIFGFFIDFKIIGQLLTSRDYPEKAYSNIDEYILQIVVYYILIIIFSAALGYISKKIVRHYKWDSKWKVFRFKNAWHYILTGEFFNFHRAAFDLAEDSIDAIDFVHIDALVDTKDGTVIYDGFFVDYELSQNGGLESISLKDVERRLLLNDSVDTIFNHKERHYKIPGHILVIPANNIININITYYKFVQMNGTDGVPTIGIEMIR